MAAHEDKELLVHEYVKTRDILLKDKIVLSYKPLVEYIARRLAFYKEDIPDLVQVGSIGLLKSLDNFAPERKVAFSTFASSNIVGEIRHYLRDKVRIVKVPRKIHDNYSKISQFIKTYLQEHDGKYPTVQLISENVEMPEDFVLECLEAVEATKVVSLDKPLYQGSSSQLGDQATLVDNLGITHKVDEPLDEALIKKAISQLSERKKLIIQLRFYEGMTQREISERMNCSQMHISRLLQDSLAELKEILSDSFSEED